METLLLKWSIRKRNYDILNNKINLINKITLKSSIEYEEYVKKRINAATKIQVFIYI